MMKRIGFLLIFMAFIATTSFAFPLYTDGLDSLQTVFNDIADDGVNDVIVATDSLSDTADSVWKITGTGSSSANMIIEVASFFNVNAFGIYDIYDSTNTVLMFNGDASAGTKVGLTVDSLYNFSSGYVGTWSAIDSATFTSSSFGFYLTSGSGYTYYSDSALNNDGVDHLLAYAGVGEDVTLPNTPGGPWTSSEYILAWEDLNFVGFNDDGSYKAYDGDFTDMVLMVESMSPVPEPATLLLLGSGLVGLAFLKRRKS